MRIRRLLLTLAVPLLVLAACGDDSADISTATPAAALAQAADAYEDAGSVRMAMTITMSGLDDVGDVTMDAEGAFDASGQGHLRTDMSSLFDAVAASELGGVDLGDGVMEVRVLEDAAYLRFPPLSMLLGGDAEWVRMSVEEFAGHGAGIMSPVPGGDPTELLRVLGGGEDIETVGTEDVRGVETTHYRGTFDVDAAAEQLAEDQRAEFDEAIAALGSDAAFPIDVWLDGEGLVRRMTITADGARFGGLVPRLGAGTLSMEMVLELYDYGAELEPVEAPTDYVDGSELPLLGGLLGGLGG